MSTKQYFFIQHPDDGFIPIKHTSDGTFSLLDDSDGPIYKLYPGITINDVKPLLESQPPQKLIQQQSLIPIHLSSIIQQHHTTIPQDLVQLEDLSEGSLLHTLRNRFAQRHIYTWLSNVLVCLNPFKAVPIYDEEQMKYYYNYYTHGIKGELTTGETGNTEDNTVPPHIYAMSAQMLASLSKHQHQSAIVTGGSGSGKSRSIFYILKYLTSTNVFASNSSSQDPAVLRAQEICAKILSFSPVLESLGNAKTINNANSSRFGKYVSLYFQPNSSTTSYTLHGAAIQQYLLEKSRVISQSGNERNYHIFYQLLSNGVVDDEKKLLQLNGKTVQDFKILEGAIHNESIDTDITGNNDQMDFLNTKNALLQFFDYSSVVVIFKVLSALLYMGNIEFTKDEKAMNDAGKLDPKSEAEIIPIVVDLLCIDQELFIAGLLKTKILAGRDMVTKVKSKAQAESSLSSLIKCIYNSLFNFIIHSMNQQLLVTTPHNSNSNNLTLSAIPPALPPAIKTIGLLDIFGFEMFPTNHFEQLLINYTNENLFHFFTSYIITLELEQYRLDGINIDMSLINYKDNTDVINLIDPISSQSSTSLLAMTSDELKIPRGTDLTLLEKFNAKHENNKYYIKQKTTNTMQFGVKHYAADIIYNIDEFLFKNRDEVQIDLLHAVYLSSIPQIKQILILSNPSIPTSTSPGGSAPATKNTNTSVALQFKASLSSLLNVLNNSQPYFVCCVKSNTQAKSFHFNGSLILQQINTLGLRAICGIRKQGYPHRLKFLTFLERYFILVMNIKANLSQLEKEHGDLLDNTLRQFLDTVVSARDLHLADITIFPKLIKLVLNFYTSQQSIQYLGQNIHKSTVSTSIFSNLKISQKIDFAIGNVNVYYRNNVESYLEVCRNYHYELQLNALIVAMKTKVIRKQYLQKQQLMASIQQKLTHYHENADHLKLSNLSTLNNYLNNVIMPCYTELSEFFYTQPKGDKTPLFEHYSSYSLNNITNSILRQLFEVETSLQRSDKVIIYQFLLLKLFIEQQIDVLEFVQRAILTNQKLTIYNAILLFKNIWNLINIQQTQGNTPMVDGYKYVLFYNYIIDAIMGSNSNHLIYKSDSDGNTTNELIDLKNITSDEDVTYVISKLQRDSFTVANLPYYNDSVVKITNPAITIGLNTTNELRIYQQQTDYKTAILLLKDLLLFDLLYSNTEKERSLELAAQLVNTAKSLNISSSDPTRYQQSEALYQQITLEIAEKERLRKEKEEKERLAALEKERLRKEKEEKERLQKEKEEQLAREHLAQVEQVSMDKERLRIEKEREEIAKQCVLREGEENSQQIESYNVIAPNEGATDVDFSTPIKQRPGSAQQRPLSSTGVMVSNNINLQSRKQQTNNIIHLIKKGNCYELSSYLNTLQNSKQYVEHNSNSIFDVSLQQAIANINHGKCDHTDDGGATTTNPVAQYYANTFNKKLAHVLNTPYDCVNIASSSKQALKNMQNNNDSNNSSTDSVGPVPPTKDNSRDANLLYLPLTHALLHCQTQVSQSSSLITSSPLPQQTNMDYNYDIVEILLSYGASINAITYSGLSTLSLLLKQSKFQVAAHCLTHYNAVISQYDCDESSRNNVGHCLASGLYKMLYPSNSTITSPKESTKNAKTGNLKQLREKDTNISSNKVKTSAIKQFIELLQIFLEKNGHVLFKTVNNENATPYHYLQTTINTFLKECNHSLKNDTTATASSYTNTKDVMEWVQNIDKILKDYIKENDIKLPLV